MPSKFFSYYFQYILLTLWCLWLSLQVASYVVKQKDDDVEVLKVAKKIAIFFTA